jgi:hypothetical protein
MLPILAALLLGATPGAGPLAAAPPSADRGDVRTGPPLTQGFEITHRGQAGTITITGVAAGCGCLKPAVSRTTLRPGESADLTVTVNTLTQPPGPHAWRTTVRYRVEGDGPPHDHELELTLSARLVQEISVTPPGLALSTAGEATQTVTVSDRRANPLTVRSATTTSPHLTAAVGPPGSANGVRTQTVVITVRADYPPGQADEGVVLLTTDPGCPELRVPVRVTKRRPGAVSAAPEAAEVRFARGQTEASGLVQLRRPGGGELQVERVECDHPAVRAKWPAAAGPVATVRVVVDRDKAGGRGGKAEVRVLLADPPGETVALPVTWVVPDSK